MANQEHSDILKLGVDVWNLWRMDNNLIVPNLRYADLKNADLSYADLSYSDLTMADLSNAALFGVDFLSANLRDTKIRNSKLIDAHLTNANFSNADLSGSNLRVADLLNTEFRNTILSNSDFTDAKFGQTVLVGVDLRNVEGLEKTYHFGPSFIGIDTLYKSGGSIPEVFLRACGVPDDFITFIPSHFGVQQAIQFYSCFISYSSKDEEFAKRLYSRMRNEHLRVWFAPEDIAGGKKLHEQIEQAIQIHDRLLVVLSENSLSSEWVMTEIRKARKIEVKEKRRKLFPIRLVDFSAIREWECFDADTGKDLAVEMREYFIPDFSNWKDHDAFEKGFKRLLRDLRAEESNGLLFS